MTVHTAGVTSHMRLIVVTASAMDITGEQLLDRVSLPPPSRGTMNHQGDRWFLWPSQHPSPHWQWGCGRRVVSQCILVAGSGPFVVAVSMRSSRLITVPCGTMSWISGRTPGNTSAFALQRGAMAYRETAHRAGLCRRTVCDLLAPAGPLMQVRVWVPMAGVLAAESVAPTQHCGEAPKPLPNYPPSVPTAMALK